jgi:Extracellular link domain
VVKVSRIFLRLAKILSDFATCLLALTLIQIFKKFSFNSYLVGQLSTASWFHLFPLITEEVFHLGGYKYTLEEATDACREIGGVLSSKSQQEEAFQQGASWCSWGWSTDGNGYFPNSVDFVGSPACGTPNNLEGPVTSDELNRNEGLLGATCYGVKPSKESIPASANVKPFNRFLWSIYDKTA